MCTFSIFSFSSIRSTIFLANSLCLLASTLFFCWRFRIKHKFSIGRGKYTFTSHQKQGDDLHDTSKNWINIKIGVSEYETSGKHEYEVFRTMGIARKMGELKEKIRKRIDYRNVMGQHTETEEKRRRKIL